MTDEIRDYANDLGLFENIAAPEIQDELQLARQYVLKGIPVPRPILLKIQRVRRLHSR